MVSENLILFFFLALLFNTLTFCTAGNKPNTFTNSVDPDEMAHNEPSHLDLHCLSICIQFCTDTPICNNGHIQIQGRLQLTNTGE